VKRCAAAIAIGGDLHLRWIVLKTLENWGELNTAGRMARWFWRFSGQVEWARI